MSPSATSPPTRQLAMLAALRSRMPLIVGVIALSVGAGWYHAKETATTTFSAEAMLHVSRSFIKTLEDDQELSLKGKFEYESFRNSQLNLLRRPDLHKAAIESLGDKKGLWVKDGEPIPAAAQRLSRALQAEALRQTYLIEVKLSSPSPQTSAQVLNAVIDTFILFHQKDFFHAEKERRQVVADHLEKLDVELTTKRERSLSLADELHVPGFGSDADHPLRETLKKARERHEKAKVAVKDAEISLESLELYPATVLGTGGRDNDESAGLAMQDPTLDDVLQALATRRSQLVLEIENISPSHPGWESLKKDLAKIDTRIQEMRTQALEQIQKVEVAKAEAKLHEARAVLAAATKAVEGLQNRLRGETKLFELGRRLTAEIAADEVKRVALVGRLDFFDIESKSPGFVWPVSYAVAPNRGESDFLNRLLIVVMLGVVIALGIPIGLEFLDRRLHSALDLHAACGFSPLGWVVSNKIRGSAPIVEDQLRRIAQALDRDFEGPGPHLLLFTGVRGNVGNTTLVGQIAKQLDALDRKVLLVEGDRRTHSSGKRGGLADLILGNATQETSKSAGDLDCLSFGADAEDLSLHELADRLRSHYADRDFILVDGPPILESADAELLASRVDGVVLVTCAAKTVTGEVKRASGILSRIHPPSLGAILVQARVQTGRGYFKEFVKQAKEREDKFGAGAKPHRRTS